MSRKCSSTLTHTPEPERVRKMDPKANILAQVEIVRRTLWRLAHDLPASSQDWEQLVELVMALDEWRKHGGDNPIRVTVNASIDRLTRT